MAQDTMEHQRQWLVQHDKQLAKLEERVGKTV